MKKCPFCKADIEDQARFCLYCMKSLNEKEVINAPQRKKPRWLLVAAVSAAVVLMILLVVSLLIDRKNADLPGESTGGSAIAGNYTDSRGSESTQNTRDTGSGQPGTSAAAKNSDPTHTTSNPTQGTTLPNGPTQGTTSPTVSTKPTDAPTQNTTPPETPKPQPVYAYRAARDGDDYNAQYQNTGNDIVITGILQSATDGVYDIPSSIDGKRVIAIVSNAFSGSNAKTVYIPATVKTIWNYAFSGCDMTDIYFRGNAVYTESKAFSGSVTIHCSASCSDRNFNYYKNCAASYGATWAEWNG